MELPPVVTRAEWLRARKQLLEREKAATRSRDDLNEARRKLPMVRVDKPYTFEGLDGPLSLQDLFAQREQLIVCHVMFHREQSAACAGCSFSVDNLPELSHLHARETTLVVVSRAPYAELHAFQQRMGWKVPWYSAFGSTTSCGSTRWTPAARAARKPQT